MDKLTFGLVAAAAALGFFATRDARKTQGSVTPVAAGLQPEPPPRQLVGRATEDDGMVVLRNDPIDDGMIVRSPFDGDRGMAKNAGSGDRRPPAGAQDPRRS